MPRRSRKHRPLRYRGVDLVKDSDPALNLSPWWRRAVAYPLDSAILVGAAAVVFLALEGHSYFAGHIGRHGWLIRLLILTIVGVLYYAPLMRLTDGQTIGKRLLRIRVVRTDGKPMTATRAIWRQVVLLILLSNVGRFVGGGIDTLSFFVYVIDDLWPIWDHENRALHDMLAGTRVRFVARE